MTEGHKKNIKMTIDLSRYYVMFVNKQIARGIMGLFEASAMPSQHKTHKIGPIWQPILLIKNILAKYHFH